eukprot:1389030-Amorphochlora_amoeboformis.AAC.1
MQHLRVRVVSVSERVFYGVSVRELRVLANLVFRGVGLTGYDKIASISGDNQDVFLFCCGHACAHFAG